MALFKTLVAVVLAGLVTANRQDRFFDTTFSQNGDSFKFGANMNFGELERTVDQMTSSFGAALGQFADALEKQVDESLPPWMQDRHDTHANRADMEEGEIEAITGGLGDGVDDGLKVHFENNKEVDLEGPVEEPNSTEETNRPNNGVSLFNPFMPFGGLNRPGFDFFNIRRRAPWWKGENVCVDREEIDEGGKDEEDGSTTLSDGNTFIFSFGHMEMTSCKELDNRYTCTTKTSRRGIRKTVTVTYRCCHGYLKEASGCTKVNMRSMEETLQDIGATDFLSLALSAGMKEMLTHNITVFAPTNEAMQEFTEDLIADEEIDNGLLDGDRTLNEVYLRYRRSINSHGMVLSHMSSGIHYGSDLRDEQVLESMEDNSTLRINMYSTVPPTATVNCARMVTINQHSTSGVVHTIDKILKPVNKNLAELISEDEQFSILKQLINAADMTNTLSEPGQLTVFAPTDAAFKSLPESLLDALLQGNACLDSVIKNHILPNVICSAALQGKAKTVNLLETYLIMEKTDEAKMFVGESQIVARDIMGTNGVLHIVDAPLMPQEGKPVREVLENHNLTSFMDLLEAAEMMDELDSLTDVTIFAPSNKAIDSLPEDIKDQIMADNDKLRQILNYHITTPTLKGNEITNNHIANTRANLPIRINLYSRIPLLTGIFRNPNNPGVRMTAACSPISNLNARACGAVVHVVEKLFVVPQETIMDHLENKQDFSIFREMIKNTGLNETLIEEGPFTVLAPSDHVFRTLPKAELDELQGNKDLQETLIKQHTLKEHICCTGINPSNWLNMDHKRALDGSAVHVRRANSGRLMAGPARITHCSAPTKNGLVHTVNNLMININPQKNSRAQERVHKPVFSVPGLDILFG